MTAPIRSCRLLTFILQGKLQDGQEIAIKRLSRASGVRDWVETKVHQANELGFGRNLV